MAATTVAERGAPISASWAAITSPLRIRSTNSPPPSAVGASQLDEAAGDDPGALAGVPGVADLLALGELARAHPLDDGLELVLLEVGEQGTACQGGIDGHQTRA